MSDIRVLSIDIETYSSVDLFKSGVYPYAEADDFEVLLFAYAWDDEPVQVVELASGGELPADVLQALTDPAVLKTAWNAQFERVCLGVYLNRLRVETLPFDAPFSIDPSHTLPVDQWACSMVHAYYLGLPGSLDAAAKSVGVENQKDRSGTLLINYFSKTCKPTKANGGRTRNLPGHDADRWSQFVEYCAQDVRTERDVRDRLIKFPVPEREWGLWHLDQKINGDGFMVDPELVGHAVTCDKQYQERLMAEAKAITELDNPNSVAQLKSWFSEEKGLEIESLNKQTVSELMDEVENEKARRVLELRQEMSRSSVKKYEAMQHAVCSDRRVRGLVQFYGANRTGRWAGRLVQVQNLPRNSMSDLDDARSILRSGDYEMLGMLWDSLPDVLSQLIRTAFVPSPGHRLIVSDFSAIEARVIAWLANEKWRLDVFNSHGMIYEASASQMFNVPIEEVVGPLRDKGKVAELALGYQGGPNALIAMGALEQGLTEEELPGLVRTWRNASPNIEAYWKQVNHCAMDAIQKKTNMMYSSSGARVTMLTNTEPTEPGRDILFSYDSGMLRVRLPSGRCLHYVRPRIEIDPRFDREGITFENRGRRERTFGGKLVENITQAVARDCLAEALIRLDNRGFKIIAHVHDEVVLEVPEGESSVDEVTELMSQPIDWADGLPLVATAFETNYYKKD